jgi:hypothetical protein
MVITPPIKSQKKFVHCKWGNRVKSMEDSKQERHRTLERYKRLLQGTSDPERQRHLLQLIKEAEEKKIEAGDSGYQY